MCFHMIDLCVMMVMGQVTHTHMHILWEAWGQCRGSDIWSILANKISTNENEKQHCGKRTGSMENGNGLVEASLVIILVIVLPVESSF